MEQQMEVKRFDIKTEPKVIKALAKFFDESDSPISEEEAIKIDGLFRLDTSNVCMIQAKTEEAKRALSRFVDKERRESTLSKLDYETNYGTGSKYSSDYLKLIMNLLDINEESVKIFVSKDYPATFENENFKVILAPRVGGD